MSRGKSIDPSHKAWLATVEEEGKRFDVVVCVSGDGSIRHSMVKSAFKPSLVKLVPLPHPVRVISGGGVNGMEVRDGVRYCKSWLLGVRLGEKRKDFDLLVVASGDNVLSAEGLARGFIGCVRSIEPFRKQIRIDRSTYM